MSTDHDPLNRRAFIKYSGIALFSAASFTPTEAAAQQPDRAKDLRARLDA